MDQRRSNRVSNTYQTIHIEPLAPHKPRQGQPCNGCGVCCLAQPCPIGMLLSGRREGACSALAWDLELRVYRCGAVVQPKTELERRFPVVLRPLAGVLAPVLGAVATRSIAVGLGCDSSLDVSHRPARP